MRLMGIAGFLVLLAVAVLEPGLTESRQVHGNELKAMLQKRLHLPRNLLRHKARIIKTIVCEVNRRTQLQTDTVSVIGSRITTTDKPTTTTTTTPPTTTTTTTTPSPRSNREEIGGRRRQRAAVMEDEGSGMVMTTTNNQMKSVKDEADEGSGTSTTIEDELNKEEDKFNEGQLMRDDNTLEADSSEEENRSTCSYKLSDWSLGYYGIFTLSDSHFCCSGYRWSRNVCKTNCRAFTDDDISDDVDCLIKSGFWRYLLRMASPLCW
ncbi:unnamed protein product [Ophioblennius macclurei]